MVFTHPTSTKCPECKHEWDTPIFPPYTCPKCGFVIEEECNHQWEQKGYWNGQDEEGNEVNGYIAQCTKCEMKIYFIREEWEALPDTSKISLIQS